MRKATLVGLMLGLAMLVSAAQVSAAPIIYTDEGLWNSATWSRSHLASTEVFDDQILQPWLTIDSDQPGVITNQWTSVVDSTDTIKMDTFKFSWPKIFAWCATLNLADPGDEGEGINIFSDIGGVDTLVGTLPRTYKDFWGFLVPQGQGYITYVRFEGAGDPLGVQETYNLDDLSIAADPIPEPASLLLFGTGLVGAAGRVWRKRRSN
jgi:hypothetical protein